MSAGRHVVWVVVAVAAGAVLVARAVQGVGVRAGVVGRPGVAVSVGVGAVEADCVVYLESCQKWHCCCPILLLGIALCWPREGMEKQQHVCGGLGYVSMWKRMVGTWDVELQHCVERRDISNALAKSINKSMYYCVQH